MNSLSRSPELLEVLLAIELNLTALGWIEIQRQGNRRLIFVRNSRLINWAAACCEKSISPALVSAIASTRSPDKQWWILRQLLPDAAVLTLAAKLEILAGNDPKLSNFPVLSTTKTL